MPGSATERGLTFLEVMVSFLLLATVIGAVLTLYAGILGGTRRSDVDQEAVAALDSVTLAVQERARRDLDSSLDLQGELDGFTYTVEDLGFQSEPLSASPELVRVKKVGVALAVPEPHSKSTHRLEVVLLVGD